MNRETPVGEVIEATAAGFTAQSRLNEPPPLGSLVQVVEPREPVLAVVCDAQTSSLDPGRHPVARGQGQELAELYRQNPHLPHLLRTTFTAVVVGHRQPGRPGMTEALRHYLPPGPVPLYAPVYPCPRELVRDFTASFDFLPLLLAAPQNGDEATAACLRLAAEAHPSQEGQGFLVAAGKALAELLAARDPQRLSVLLRRLGP